MEKKKKIKKIVNRLIPIVSIALFVVMLLSTTVAATNGAGGTYNVDLVSNIPLKYVKSYDVVGFSLQSFDSENEIMISPFDMYLYDIYNWSDSPNPNYTQTYVMQYPFIEGSGTRPFHLYGTYYSAGAGYTIGPTMIWDTDYYIPGNTGSTNRNIMNASKTEYVYNDFVLSPKVNWESSYIDGIDYNDYNERISISPGTYITQEALSSVPYRRVTISGSAYIPSFSSDGNIYSYDIVDLSSSVLSTNVSGLSGRSVSFDIGDIYKILYDDGRTIPYEVPIMVSNLSIVIEPFVNGSLQAVQPSSSYYSSQGEYSSSLVNETSLYTCGDFMEEYPLTRIRTEFMSGSNFFSSITRAVSSFFNTDLFGSFSIGDLMLVSVGFGLLMFILKMFRG